MLVLARKTNEAIMIYVGDEQIRIEILEIDKSKCRLGIQAPRHFRIWRAEVLDNGRINHEA